MPKWIRRVIPCLGTTKQEKTDQSKTESLTDFENTDKINESTAINYNQDENTGNETNNDDGNVIVQTSENYEGDNNMEKFIKVETKDENKDKEELNIRKHIACTLHESLNDFSQSKVTHTSLKPRSLPKSNKEKPRNTLVFKTVMLNGEPCTTRYKTTEEVKLNSAKSDEKDESDKKLAEEIKGSDIKLVFSHDVLEYLTKSFLHNQDNDLKRNTAGANDAVVCTLFPKYVPSLDERSDVEMEIDNNITELNLSKSHNNSETHSNNTMDTDEMGSNCTDQSSSTMQTDNDNLFNQSQFSLRSGYQFSSPVNNQMININSPMSKSSPHMQQDNNGNIINKEMSRLRRNMSKRVSWKENVEVCFFNHSSKSANEILQEEQPLIDHEVYWKECVGEMDRKRHEIWLKIRADEQRCLTGDGQFHDYFTYRTHHFEEDELAIQ